MLQTDQTGSIISSTWTLWTHTNTGTMYIIYINIIGQQASSPDGKSHPSPIDKRVDLFFDKGTVQHGVQLILERERMVKYYLLSVSARVSFEDHICCLAEFSLFIKRVIMILATRW